MKLSHVAGTFLASVVLLNAQESKFRSPSLGWYWDNSRQELRPMMGRAGAAYLGEAQGLGFTPAQAAFSPQHDYGLFLDNATQSWRLFRSSDASVDEVALKPVPALAERIAFSPDGRTVALLGGQTATIVSGLPARPSISTQTLGSAAISALALSDSGTLAWATATAVYLTPKGAESRQFAKGHFTALAFRPGSTDLALGDTSAKTISLLSSNGILCTLADASDGIEQAGSLAFTDSGTQLLSAGAKEVAVISIPRSVVQHLACQCEVSGLSRLDGHSLYRISEPAGGPLWMLDLSAQQPRLLFVAAAGGSR